VIIVTYSVYCIDVRPVWSHRKKGRFFGLPAVVDFRFARRNVII
jgi:hypothetical protein